MSPLLTIPVFGTIALLAFLVMYYATWLGEMRIFLKAAERRADSNRQHWVNATSAYKLLQERLFREWALRELMDGWDAGNYDLVERSIEDIDLIVDRAQSAFYFNQVTMFRSFSPTPRLLSESETRQRYWIIDALGKIQAERQPKPETVEVTLNFTLEEAASDVRAIAEKVAAELKRRKP